MKVQCKVEVINRLHNSLNVKISGKHVRSTLALGIEPKSENGYFILHFSSVHKNGIKYSVRKIKQVFTKFINEGKATIRFEEPPHDLCINCEVIQLKCFIKLLRSCIVGRKDVELPKLSNISVTTSNNNPTKLVVNNRSEFPKSLPRTLENLSLKGLKLHNFRREILLLRHLVILDLSNNEIEKIPPEFGRMPCLSELYLSNNQLGASQTIDWSWLLGVQISETLRLLDISGNKIAYLPRALGKLQKLITLKVDNNLLQELPFSVGRISTLRYLQLSKNKLKVLPCSLLQCRLYNIDVSYNDFEQDIIELISLPWEYKVKSLLNIAARAVLKDKIYYAPNIIPRSVVEYLDNSRMCTCGMHVFSDKYYIKNIRIKDYFPIVVCDKRIDMFPFLSYFCSRKCLGVR